MPSKRKRPAFYVVARGRTPGVYKDWNEAHAQVTRFSNALHKGFDTVEEANEWLSRQTAIVNIVARDRRRTSATVPLDASRYLSTYGSCHSPKEEAGSTPATLSHEPPVELKESDVSRSKPSSLSGSVSLDDRPALRGSIPSAPPSIPLSAEQSHVVNLAEEGCSVFFTGSAGVGKSLILAHLCERLRAKGKRISITAPTGIAAVQVGGQTIHSFAGIGKGDKGCDRLLNTLEYLEQRRSVWIEIDILIIDEVSMLHPDLFVKLDFLARTARKSNRAFGGVQLVVCGDFYQLQPVDNEREKSCFKCGAWVPPTSHREYLSHDERQIHGDKLEEREMIGISPTRWLRCKQCRWLWNDTVKFAFQTRSWKDCGFRNIVLKKVFRQSNQEWVDTLAQIKEGNMTLEVLRALTKLRRELKEVAGIKPTKLYSHRADVEAENAQEFFRLASQPRRYHAVDSGAVIDKLSHTCEQLSSNALSEDSCRQFFKHLQATSVIDLKHGAQVMLLANIGTKEGLVNGTRGIVMGFRPVSLIQMLGLSKSSLSKPEICDQYLRSNDCANEGTIFLPLVRFITLANSNSAKTVTSELVTILPVEWEMTLQYTSPSETLRLRRIQLPLTLAWATTIHKSQGLTLDYVCVDISRAFSSGQAYVGLSRSKSPEGLQILGNSREWEKRIWVDEVVQQFYRWLESNHD